MLISKKMIFSLLIVSFIAHATSKDEESNYLDIKRKYTQADHELNELYSTEMQKYKKEGGDFYGQALSKDMFLKKSQQIWIRFRDASCDYETYESQTGTGYQSIHTQCLLDKTNERIKYLKENN
ncbi:lysozyme inhibitor LprI family protein [Ewingella allii]|uniref:lysozyme inhibitor LprI family protein n=1 Tax=Ewingella allii TaxID=3092550 RepID=UPI00379C17C5